MASVNSFYEPNSPVTQESVINAMNTAIRDCEAANCGILANAQYTGEWLEKRYYLSCDMNRECFNVHIENHTIHFTGFTNILLSHNCIKQFSY